MSGSKSLPIHTTLPLPAKVRQIDGIQILRAVAVISVAWTHTGQELGTRPGVVDFGVIGVDIFFVISGFILSSVVLRERRPAGVQAMWHFLKRRLLRIFPIYWFFACLALVRLRLAHQPADARYLPAFFLLPSLRGSQAPLLVAFSWTLLFEMFFYYALSLILLWTVRRAVPMLIVLLTVFVAVGHFFDIRHPVWIIVCNPILLEFVFGAVAALVYARFHERRSVGLSMVFIGSVLSVYLAIYPPASVANGQQMVMLNAGVLGRVLSWGIGAGLIVAGTVLWSPSTQNRLSRLFVLLGTASYSAYLASPLIIEYTWRLLLRVRGATAATEPIVSKCIVVLCVLGLGWLCYNLIEWPLLRGLQAKLTK